LTPTTSNRLMMDIPTCLHVYVYLREGTLHFEGFTCKRDDLAEHNAVRPSVNLR
jgi:hypothetical protein